MQQYLDLLQTIKEKGTYKPAAREGMPGTLSLFGYQFRHDLSKGFPLLTTKKLSFKNIVVELLSFLRGDETIEFLQENNCKIWDEDVEKFDPVDKIHWGKQYPYLWRNWGGNLRDKKRDKSKFKLEEPINTILETEELETYKTLSYGEFIHTFGDVHIYDNHKEQVDLQLTRTPKELPTLKIVDEGNDWAAISNLDFDLIEMLGPEDFIIEGYNPHPSIKGKLSTGLK